MNPHALAVLEFARVLDDVAGRASSEAGAAAVRALAPRTDRPWLEREQARVAAVRALVEGPGGFGVEAVPALVPALARLRVDGVSWTPAELLGGATLIRSARAMRAALTDPARPAAARALLADLADRLPDLGAVADAIGRVIADDGTVRDDASPALRRLRRALRDAETELVTLLEQVLRTIDPQHRVADGSITVRNGRYVVPVRRGGQAQLGGFVHDASQSGQTLFVEPPAAIAFANRVREVEAAEREEVERLVLECTDRLRPHHPALVAALDALIELDTLTARARYARDVGASPVTFVAPGTGVTVRDGRHPLLLAQGVAVVPFDLVLEPGERTLLVSGPNTGGKTVLLKALGLFAAVAQSGVPVPVGAESRLPAYDDVFADVGDEQSLQASLSTFSAHLRHQGEILRAATAASLVLIDELGSGTDPLDGAALGGAILEALTQRGTTTVATTHLGALKDLALQVPGVVNASLQFDAEALAPTYRLLKGVPGRSYGIAIARRLALPEAVVARAEARIPEAERQVSELLAELEQKEAALADRTAALAAAEAQASARARRVLERETHVRAREREIERRARQEARRFLLDARAEVDRAVQAMRAADGAARDEAARAARQRIEEAVARQGDQLDRLDREERKRQRVATAGGPVAVGDTVEVATAAGALGRVLELREDDAVVLVGAVRMTVPRDTVARSTRALPRPDQVVPVRGDHPELDAKPEVDLRGLRVDELEEKLLGALDAAVQADLKVFRVIHGKGTGALRERVSELLTKDTRVRGFRLGAWNEGGAGVTVAELA